VLDRQGKIVHLEKLKKSLHTQPEGICFDADGTMFIANEGKDGRAKIFKFRYKQ
jgi:sugar lactone lactonase YvrE